MYYRAIARLASRWILMEDIGYEMGCLISSEFTPAPDYSYALKKVKETCEACGMKFEEFMERTNVYMIVGALNDPKEFYNKYTIIYTALKMAENHQKLIK